MEFKLHNGSGGLCCKSCGRQDKQLNTYDWLADIPGNADESELVEVQFKNTRKGYFRNSNKIPLEKGDIVAVEATPGHDIGVVTLTGRLVPLQMKKANIKSITLISLSLSLSDWQKSCTLGTKIQKRNEKCRNCRLFFYTADGKSFIVGLTGDMGSA